MNNVEVVGMRLYSTQLPYLSTNLSSLCFLQLFVLLMCLVTCFFCTYTDKSTVCNWCHISLVNKKSIIFKKIILMKSFHICWFSSSIVLWNITPILDVFLHFSPLLNTPYLIIYNLISFETFFLSLYQWVNSLVLPLGNPWENILPCGQLMYTKDLLNSMTLWCGVDIMEFQHANL